jgi:hypothetical protein
MRALLGAGGRKMGLFKVTPSGSEAEAQWGFGFARLVRDACVEQAATAFAREEFGCFARAVRCTGLPGDPGVFQAFVPQASGLATPVGCNFHVGNVEP